MCFSVHNIFFNKLKRITKKGALVFILLFLFTISYTQQYTNYTTKNGLPSNHTYTIVQDSKGFIWFLTDKGMVKFNGSSFKTFTTKQGLPNNDVWDAFTTPDSKIWYFSKSPKLGYIVNDSVYAFPSSKENIMIPLFSSQIGNNVYPTGPLKTYFLKKNKWEVLYENKLGLIDNTKIYHPNIDYFNYTINDSLILFGKNKMILKKIYAKDIKFESAIRGQLNDSLFFWASETKYSFLNLNTLELKRFYFKNQLKLNKIKHARINIVNHKIQISGSGFVANLDSKLKIKDPFYFPNNIQAHFGLIDKLNNIWLATFNNGIYKLPTVKQNIKYSLTHQKVNSFNWINNQLIASVYNKGFYKFNKKTREFTPFIKAVDFIYRASKIKESEYYLSKNQLITIKNGSQEQKKYQFNDYSVIQLVYFNNTLYGHFSFGLLKLNSPTLTYNTQYNQRGINDLLVFNDQLLIATTKGLKEFKNGKFIPITLKQPFTKPILKLSKISNTEILINTDGFGSYITDLNEIHPLEKSDFLSVQDAFIDKSNIWLATNIGVSHYIKKNKQFIFNKNFDESDGLPEKNINAIYALNNELIVGTNNGIAVIPINQNNKSQLLNVYFENATYNNKSLLSQKKDFKYQKNNTIRFTASTIDFSEHPNTSFLYKLEPLQTQWQTSNSSTFNFNNLQPNKYTFSIKSGISEKKISFKITPLWYQKLFSKILFGLFILSIFTFILIKIRNREISKKIAKINAQKQLAEYELHALRSQMNPHFVFNALNSIQYYITKNEIDLSEKYLVKFSRLIRKFFDFSRNKFISLKQEISLLENYLEIEKMRFGKDFIYKFNIDEKLNLTKQKIPSMLLQPIVENSVNHGLFHNEGKGIITVEFIHRASNKFDVIITDNGVGLQKAKEIKENSLKTHISKSNELLKNRIELLNQSNEWSITYTIIELVNGNGTSVKLTFRNNE